MAPMDKYEILKELGDGTFGSVVMATNRVTGETVAIKQIKRKIENWDELREVKALARLGKHNNIIKLKEVVRDHKADELNYVFEYMSDGNLFDKMREVEAGGYMMEEYDVKKYTFQLLQGLSYMHGAGLFHRDLKPENLLLSGDILKIADFGLAREIQGDAHTEYVTTRWYRAPEILLKSPTYTAAIDMWSVGTILAEFTTLQALLPGSSEIDQIFKTCSLIGNPLEADADENTEPEEVDNRGYYSTRQCPDRSELQGGGAWSEGIRLAEAMGFTFPDMNAVPLEQIMEHAPTESIQLIADMLLYNPVKRPTASEALEHPWFGEMWEDPRFADVMQRSCMAQVEKHVEPRVSEYNRSRESTVVERPPYAPSSFSRKTSKVESELFQQYQRSREPSNNEDTILSRRNSKQHIEDIIKRKPKNSIAAQLPPNIKERGASLNTIKIEKEKQFIQQRRELSALEKVAVDAVQSLAEKQKQLQQHLLQLAKTEGVKKSKSNKQRLMERIQDAHAEKRAVESVHVLVLQQQKLQRNLEKIAVGELRKGGSKSPTEPILSPKRAFGKNVSKPHVHLQYSAPADLKDVLPALPQKVEKVGSRKSSDSENEWGHFKELSTVLKNAEYFGNGKKEHQKYRRLMIQFLRNLETEQVVTSEFIETPVTAEDANFPADWKEKCIAFGGRLKEKIGELVSLYNEYYYEMEGIANEQHSMLAQK
ncbi:hypothetical protein HDU79_001797 [Rhizoclosmatium sp. JEL0117]|nr:hypothetical protein HDU79_001797 [Rhizoclosmatium sp. JEL0117]